MSTPSAIFESIQEQVKTRFDESKRVLSFEELFLLASKDPYRHLRRTAQYIEDAFDFWGEEHLNIRDKQVSRFKIFSTPFHSQSIPVIGQEQAQHRLLQIIVNFARLGRIDKLVVLHGPNGSAKTSLLRAMVDGLEAYSKEDAGLLFHFSWVFPIDNFEKSSLGIGHKRDSVDAETSYAKLDAQKIGAVVRSELHDNPLLLVPREHRASVLSQWVKNTSNKKEVERLEAIRPWFLNAELSHKNALIFESLLSEYNGNWKRVVQHVRVERMLLDRRFRRGLASVDPQFGVDASIRQVTLDRSLSNLPPALQSLNLFQLEGDLVDANRGVLEFNDLLKRPLESFKYLMSTCETGHVNLGHVVAYLDTLLLATTDERHLAGFREHPEYGSFKSRLEFIKVPYLVRVSEEENIYKTLATAAAGQKELLPHTLRFLALWAVLSRLKRPLLKGKSPVLTPVLEQLTPLAKAKLYDTGELPEKLSDEERRELRGHIETLIEEQQSQPYYEGLMGPSARELKAVLQAAGQNGQFETLGPSSLVYEIQRLLQRPMDFEYLRLEPNQGYHAFDELLVVAKNEWLNWVDREMRTCLNLFNPSQLTEHLGRYISHTTATIRGEKIKNRITGQNETPDLSLLTEFEQKIGAASTDEFRKNLISRLGAWTVEHPQYDRTKPLPYAEIFPDLIEKLETHFHDAQREKIRDMGEFMIDQNSFQEALSAETQTMSSAARLAVQAYKGMQEKFGYGPKGAKEVLVELLQTRYLDRKG